MRIDASKFAGQKDLFNYLTEKKSEIIELKKSALKFSDNTGHVTQMDEVVKALTTSHQDDPTTGLIKRTIVANTYNWMDSHNDVHLSGTFKQSITSKPFEKIFHLADHEFKITSRIGKITNIREQKVMWSNLGVSKFGYTEALLADSDISQEMHSGMFKAYLKNEIDQHSVGMQYVSLSLAINDPEYKEEFANWNEYRPMLGNGEKADEVGFFFAVKEAKLKEISAVLEGSNSLTPTLENKIEPLASTQKTDSDQADMQKKKFIIYY